MGIKKIQIFAQNTYVLAYGFNENRQFAAKTDRNSIFLGQESHILDQLYIMVYYTGFYRFKKIAQNPKVL
ncbi:hypothetical protein [Arcobacter sp.]|uniref:hypothetical protein n=1 Tax=Arcobacter sp. TaxID=1872629 RepID=UPI003D150AC6